MKFFRTKSLKSAPALPLTVLLLWTLPAFPQIAPKASGQAREIDVPSYDILMTDDLKNKSPVKNFSCANRVYLYFTWYLLEDMHEVTAFWINPQGKEENQIRLKFVAKKEKTSNWVALEFKNIFDDKNPIAPSLKAARMSGKWNVRVLLDGNLLESRTFNVHCG